jgi:hypothetical protein
MIQLVIRSTTTLGMVALGVIFYNIYPHNSFNNHVVIALFCWAVAFGPIHWLNRACLEMTNEESVIRFVGTAFFLLSLGFLIAGLWNFLIGCSVVS